MAHAIANAGTSIRRNIYTLEMYLRHDLGHRKVVITSKSISTSDEASTIAIWETLSQRIVSRTSLEYNRDSTDLIHISAFMHFDSIPEAIFQSTASGSGHAFTNLTSSASSPYGQTKIPHNPLGCAALCCRLDDMATLEARTYSLLYYSLRPNYLTLVRWKVGLV